jgi:membrane associated rhomboid family serine protease
VIFWKTFAIPAWVVLGVWIGLQLYDAILSPSGDAIAYWEHIGGFTAGFALALLLRAPVLRPSPLPRVPRR